MWGCLNILSLVTIPQYMLQGNIICLDKTQIWHICDEQMSHMKVLISNKVSKGL